MELCVGDSDGVADGMDDVVGMALGR